MSLQELKNLQDFLEVLAYPKIQLLIDGFKIDEASLNSFKCIAEFLLWSSQLYDPTIFQSNFSLCIKQESDRINFINFVVNELYTRGVELNAVKLYRADGSAVNEITKIASALCRAINNADVDNLPDTEKAILKFHHIIDDVLIKDIGTVAIQTNLSGIDLCREFRAASPLLDQMSSCTCSLEDVLSMSQNNMAFDTLKQDITKMIESVLDDIKVVQRHCRLLSVEEKDMHENIRMVTTDLMSKHRQIESLQATEPVFINEYTAVQTEMLEQYESFVTNVQNVCFLMKELEAYDTSSNYAPFHDWVSANDDQKTSHYIEGDPSCHSNDDQHVLPSHPATVSSIKDVSIPKPNRLIMTSDTYTDKTDNMTVSSRRCFSSSNLSSVSESIVDDESFIDDNISDCSTTDNPCDEDIPNSDEEF